jgi:hypothetical protein
MTNIPVPAPLNLSYMENVWLLRRLRAVRDKLREDMMALEERISMGHDGDLTNAHRALDGDAAICDQIIRKLWQSVGKPPGSEPGVTP